MVAQTSNSIEVFCHSRRTIIADRGSSEDGGQSSQDEVGSSSDEDTCDFEGKIQSNANRHAFSQTVQFTPNHFSHICATKELVERQLGTLGLDLDFCHQTLSVTILGGCAQSLQVAIRVLAQHMEHHLPGGQLVRSCGDQNESLKSRSTLGLSELSQVPKQPWEVRQKPHSALLNRSSLPFEVSVPGNATAWLTSSAEQSMRSHLPITRTVSDSCGQQKRHFAALCTARRKLESEDSSYDSDHDNHETSMGSIILRPPSVQISKSHDDVSRTPSETLATEFAEHVNLYQGPPKSREPSPNQPHFVIVNHDASYDQERLQKIIQDPTYNSRVEFALRLGYSETLLQKALLKLGQHAQENQLLEELIRLQKSKPSFPEDNPDGSHSPLVREDSLVGLSGGKSFLYTSPEEDQLLPIVIDGSNVAMSHGNKDVFSCKGIRLCVNWFESRGHKDITVFVPKWRKETSRPDTPITDQHVLLELEKDRLLSFTPSRQVRGKRYVCHDDRYILNLAAETGAVVVSNDNYRDLINEKPEFKKVIEEKILMYSFVSDRFMPPDDPLGRNGPTLDNFLKRRPSYGDLQPCPYGKKCTYGNKCKFFHAERGNQPQKSITDKLKERSSQKINEVRARGHSRDSSPGDPLLTRTKSMQPLRTENSTYIRAQEKRDLCRTRSTMPRLSLSNQESNQVLSTQQTHLPASGQGAAYWHNATQPHCTIQQTVSLGPTMIQMFHNPPDPTRSCSYENVTQDHSDQHSQQPMWGGAAGKFSNVSYNMPDTSMPPPAPRGPWSQVPASGMVPDEPPMDPGNSHRKLARQLTLNPMNDPRIRQHPPPSFPFPPPTGLPPPNFSSANTLPPAMHATVTRNASAPEQSLMMKGLGESGPGLALAPSPLGSFSRYESSGDHAHLQRINSTSDSQLHKTLSCSLGGDSTWKPLDQSPIGSNANVAVSPLIGSSDGVWEASSVLSAVTTIGDTDTARSKLYYHLAQLFPEDQVILAMRALPDETDVQEICTYIILNSKNQS